MNKTRLVNIRKEPFEVYIGRAGHGQGGYFGNPYSVGKDGTRKEVLEKYKNYFLDRISTDSEFCNKVNALRGRTLGCFCVEKAWTFGDPVTRECHGQIIIEWLEGGQ